MSTRILTTCPGAGRGPTAASRARLPVAAFVLSMIAALPLARAQDEPAPPAGRDTARRPLWGEPGDPGTEAEGYAPPLAEELTQPIGRHLGAYLEAGPHVWSGANVVGWHVGGGVYFESGITTFAGVALDVGVAYVDQVVEDDVGPDLFREDYRIWTPYVRATAVYTPLGWLVFRFGVLLGAAHLDREFVERRELTDDLGPFRESAWGFRGGGTFSVGVRALDGQLAIDLGADFVSSPSLVQPLSAADLPSEAARTFSAPIWLRVGGGFSL